jgi:hypothetical protein
MKEELEKLLDERIDDLRDSIENGYLPEDYRKPKEEKLELLLKLKSALFGY